MRPAARMRGLRGGSSPAASRCSPRGRAQAGADWVRLALSLTLTMRPPCLLSGTQGPADGTATLKGAEHQLCRGKVGCRPSRDLAKTGPDRGHQRALFHPSAQGLPGAWRGGVSLEFLQDVFLSPSAFRCSRIVPGGWLIMRKIGLPQAPAAAGPAAYSPRLGPTRVPCLPTPTPPSQGEGWCLSASPCGRRCSPAPPRCRHDPDPTALSRARRYSADVGRAGDSLPASCQVL